jgi:hypothetical protein
LIHAHRPVGVRLFLPALALLIACGPSPLSSAPAPTHAPEGSWPLASEASVGALQQQYVDLQATVAAQQQQLAALQSAVAQPGPIASPAPPSGQPAGAPKAVAPRPADPARAALRIGGRFVDFLLLGELETALALMSPSARAAHGPAIGKLAAILRGYETVVQHTGAPAQGDAGFSVSSRFTPPCGNTGTISNPSGGDAPAIPRGPIAICRVELELVDQDWKVTAWSCARSHELRWPRDARRSRHDRLTDG